jgi:enhancing lycopene biosynthesis protein 2
MRIGVLLGGCGLYDGSDIHETVLALLALEAAGERPVLIAPDLAQGRTVDHLSADEVPGEHRNVLKESARLARGAIRALTEVHPEDLEALIIPGGYGPVVNFSSGFAKRDEAWTIRPEIAAFLRHFLEARKPIGLISLGEVPVRTLLGQELEVAPPPPDPGLLGIDRERRIVHTPGSTAFSRLADLRTGIEAMVAELLRLMAESRQETAAREGT